MPTCQNCHQEWNWIQTLKKSFTLDDSMTCPHCENKQYLTAKSRKRSSLFVLIIPPLVLIPALFSVSLSFMIFLFIGAFLLIMGCYPYMFKLSNKREPL